MNYRGNALPKRQPRFWCEVIGICIVILLAIIMDAWGHGEGECLTDVDGNVPLSDGGWVKVTDHLEGADLDGYAHGHRKQYYDKNGIPTIRTTSFFSIDFDDNDSDFYADCPTASRPPEPRRKPQPPPPTTPRPVTKSSTPEDVQTTLDTIVDAGTTTTPRTPDPTPTPSDANSDANSERAMGISVLQGLEYHDL